MKIGTVFRTTIGMNFRLQSNQNKYNVTVASHTLVTLVTDRPIDNKFRTEGGIEFYLSYSPVTWPVVSPLELLALQAD